MMKDTHTIISEDDELESQNLNATKPDRKPSGDDPVADWLLKMYYTMNTSAMQGVKIGIIVSPLIAILLFTIFVSNTSSNVIAFAALMISVIFIGISIWMLCWILDKDQGSRAM
jgi:hypothetical protein